MAFIWSLSEAKALKKAIRGQKYTFFRIWISRLLFFDRLKGECIFFEWQAIFKYYLKDNVFHVGEGGNTTSLYVAPPTLYSHARKGFSMIFVDFWSRRVDFLSIDRELAFWVCKNIPPNPSRRVNFSSIDRELAFWVPSKGTFVGVALWAWPFVGLAIARFAR